MAVTTLPLLIEDKELKGKLACHERDLAKLLRQGKDTLFRLSHELYLARNTCLDHNSEKTFGKWVEGLGISRSSAYRAISRWEGLAPKILGLPSSGVGCPISDTSPQFEGFLCFAKFDDSALDELAKPATPKKALNAAVKIAHSGKSMSKKEALELIGKHAKPESDEPIDDDSEPVPDPEDTPEDYGKCPNCAGERWKVDGDGLACMKCNHPHGEPAGDVDEDRITTQRQKTQKTCEALMRAFGDLHHLKPSSVRCAKAIKDCKQLLNSIKEWK